MTRPSSSSRLLLLGLDNSSAFLRFAEGSASVVSLSSGAERFSDARGGVEGEGGAGFTLRVGCSNGFGRINGGASAGWFFLYIGISSIIKRLERGYERHIETFQGSIVIVVPVGITQNPLVLVDTDLTVVLIEDPFHNVPQRRPRGVT
ncbi:hypothetical protein WG66_006813 [Moniliophthora roreri]|nr:hypothetical protein WG66_006813 [Moniliophthora roreri]